MAWLAARVLVGISANPGVFTVGLVLVVVPIAFLAHLAVAFPSGRVTSRFERLVVVSSYAVILAGVSFMDLSGCRKCPRNLLAVDGDAGPGRVLRGTVTVATLMAIAAFSALLVLHWERGTRAARRVLAPVLPTALLYAAVSAAELLAELGAPVGLGRKWSWVGRLALLAVPVAFLAGLLRSRLARSGVGQLVVELGDRAQSGQLRKALARALHDPTVEVAYWSTEQNRYLDAEGRPLDLAADDGSRAVAVVERAGERVGALVHDAALRDEPALLDSVCAAAGLAMENERLHNEVMARLAEVQASRTRIIEAGDAGRRRVERNLHDGAQQRLVTTSLALSMARSRLTRHRQQPEADGTDSDDGIEALLAEAGSELTAALAELRELARGIHPAILVEEGLGAAVESLAQRSSIPVEVSVSDDNRPPAPVEAAAYYVVCDDLVRLRPAASRFPVVVAVRLARRDVLSGPVRRRS